MNIVLCTVSPYVGALSGAERDNRALLEDLAARGHRCRLLGPSKVGDGSINIRQKLDALGISFRTDATDVRFELGGVEVQLVERSILLPERVAQVAEDIAADWVIAPCEDYRQRLLKAALATGRRVLYLARATTSLPAGPLSMLRHPEGLALVQRVTAIVCASRYIADYVQQWIKVPAHIVYPPHLARGPFSDLGGLDNRYVTMVNPCGIKGISIFIGMTRACPDVRFAAVPTWGTTAADIGALESAAVTILPPAENFDDILRETRVLIVPSLCYEVFGQVVVQAMARGIPVIASDIGGIPEAKLGTRYLIPVRPIEEYEWRQGVPMAKSIPDQDLGPWIGALRELLSDPALYAAEAASSRTAALAFIEALDVGASERVMLSNMQPVPKA
jgi:glycosyltransferase involved in cell wall biosynthesis